jgi:hypothetical protein
MFVNKGGQFNRDGQDEQDKKSEEMGNGERENNCLPGPLVLDDFILLHPCLNNLLV